MPEYLNKRNKINGDNIVNNNDNDNNNGNNNATESTADITTEETNNAVIISFGNIDISYSSLNYVSPKPNYPVGGLHDNLTNSNNNFKLSYSISLCDVPCLSRDLHRDFQRDSPKESPPYNNQEDLLIIKHPNTNNKKNPTSHQVLALHAVHLHVLLVIIDHVHTMTTTSTDESSLYLLSYDLNNFKPYYSINFANNSNIGDTTRRYSVIIDNNSNKDSVTYTETNYDDSRRTTNYTETNYNRNKSLIEFLVDNGVDINNENKFSKTQLFYECKS
ncbi:hypothetical protein U3516DRAFT_790214 [Neocallimastix sp. 'constans']